MSVFLVAPTAPSAAARGGESGCVEGGEGEGGGGGGGRGGGGKASTGIDMTRGDDDVLGSSCSENEALDLASRDSI